MTTSSYTRLREGIRVLQVNTGRMRDSHDLVEAEARKRGTDILIISEPNKKLAKQHLWLVDDKVDAAIVIRGNVTGKRRGYGKGYAWIEVETYRIFSCYISPNVDIGTFEDFLENLGRDVRSTSKRIILGGDFNAKSHLWGDKEDRRGDTLAEWLSQHNLVIANLGSTPTFVRRAQESVLDLTLCSGRSINRIQRWEVLEEETLSWHRMICFEIESTSSTPRPNDSANKGVGGWKITTTNMPLFEERLAAQIAEGEERGTCPNADYLTNCITRACNQAFPVKKAPRQSKTATYWWNSVIGEKRRECLAARRRHTRANRRGTNLEKELTWRDYKEKRTSLRKAILESKAESWKKLISDLDRDIFGQGYRVVTNKLMRKTHLDDKTQLEIARGLFPQAEPTRWTTIPRPPTPPPPFEEEELLAATARLKNGKAAGPDNIPPEIAKVAALGQRETLLDIANNVITERRFPSEWKTARLVLIEKPKKTPGAEPSYRPICLLNTTGKIVEEMICRRINAELESKVGLSPRQFGFRKGKSTVDAMKEVIASVEKGTRKTNNRGFSVLITIDVRNAFNSANWPKIIEAMIGMGISEYLVETVKSYLRDRTVLVGQGGALTMTCGVPQGSKLGPLLWNIMYDGVLNICLPAGVTIVGFADDIGIVVTAWSEAELEQKIQVANESVITWLTQNGLQVAPEKTEAVILAGRRTLLSMDIQVQDCTVGTSDSLKYLGVHFDKDLRMKVHIRETAKKAGGIIRNLSRLMPNIGGPAPTKRRVLNAVVNSTLLYAAPVWSVVMRMTKYQDTYTKVQRQMAIRISSAYRTVSTPAAQLLAGTIPIDLLVRERSLIYDRGREEVKNIREETMNLWQERWDNSTKGAWTKRLIPKVESWTGRQHGETDFHLTQVLSGHGCFEAYLHKIGRRRTAACVSCHEEDDTAEHTFFKCPAWQAERTTAWRALGRTITPDNMVDTMLEGEEQWKELQRLANTIMRAKEADEKKKEDEARREIEEQRRNQT